MPVARWVSDGGFPDRVSAETPGRGMRDFGCSVFQSVFLIMPENTP